MARAAADRERAAGYGPKSRERTSPPAAAISSSSQRKPTAATSCETSSETEKPLVRNALPRTRARRTRSSAASCSDGPSPCATEPRCSLTPAACSETTRAGRSLDMAAGGYPRHRPCMRRSSSDPDEAVLCARSENRCMSSRDVLPIPDRQHVGLTTYDAKDPDTSYRPIEPLLPPPGAPNVLVVLLDDAGFGSSSAFGGPCQTPAFERLAANGLKYNRFHTTALCSPSRQALLTGRNHHSVGMGGITEIATSAPGYSSVRPNTAAPIAEMLKLNGYSTAQFGKCHEVPVWETSSAGPFDRWPTGSGFEHFYGFIGGEAHQFYPALYEGTKPVEPGKTPEEGYHLTEDLADKAIGWVRQQKALAGDKPFFMYFAPGAAHAPHHAPKEWIEKYKGQFDQGWDRLREATIERQKVMAVIPRDTELTQRHDEIPAWDEMPEELKPVLIRQMECFAGMLDHGDHHVGRLVDAFDKLVA